MDADITSNLKNSEIHQNGQNKLEKNGDNYDANRIQRLVTPELEYSDNIARKRRDFTKKRTASNNLRRRDQTPVRSYFSEDEDTELLPKSPIRTKRKRQKNDSVNSSFISRDYSELEALEPERNVPPKLLQNGGTKTPQQIFEDFKENVTERAQFEFNSLVDRTKKTFESVKNRGRDFRKKKTVKEVAKRSQSAPYEIPEDDLIESFKKAQLLSTDFHVKRSNSLRKYSNTSSQKSLTPEIYEPKEFRPEVKEFVKQRKKQRSSYSSKIVEILDPTTAKVLHSQTLTKNHIGLRQFFQVLRFFSIWEICKNYRVYKKEMRNECTKIKLMRNRCFLELFVIMIFCGFGGLFFKLIEGSFENFYKCGVKRVKRDFIDMLWYKSHNVREEDWKSLARTKLRIFEEELHAAHEAGMTSYSGQRSWSFLNGIVYCLTIITTIGYGHIYPTTTTGRVLTIVYSIFGIPLFLIALTDFGKLFTRCIKFLWSFVRRLYYTGSCKRYRKQAHMEDIFKGAQMMYDIATFRRPSFTVDPEALQKGDIPQNLNIPTPLTGENVETPTTPALSNFEIDDEFNLPISVAITILLAYIFMGALIYCMWEDWNFFASFYFVFISMSTIGFGDYVPHHPICMIVSIVYLVFGLALMSMCINVVQEKLSDTFKHASAKIGATMGLRVDEDGSITTVPPDAIEMPPIHGAVDVNIDKNLEDEKNVNFEKNKTKTDDKSNFLQVNTEVNNVKDKLS